MNDLEALMTFERTRLAALVAADIEGARAMHHPEFQLVTPRGVALSREDYLGEIANGGIHYLSWEPEAMIGRVTGDAGVLRYRSRIEMKTGSMRLPGINARHTDYYERANGKWLVIFSQATAEV